MKITGHIIEVASNGDGLTVAIQAKVGKADWKPIERQGAGPMVDLYPVLVALLLLYALCAGYFRP